MKTFLFALILIGLTNHTTAQNNDLAFHKESQNTLSKTSKHLKNTDYLTTTHQAVKRMASMQQEVAAFNIRNLDIYTPDQPATYDVTFKEGNDQVMARYDENGHIQYATETYQNIRLPYEIAHKLAKDYPGWAFAKTHCAIVYSNDKPATISYKVQLQKGNQKKTVKISL